MSVDTSFYGHLQPVQVANPLDQAGKFYTLQHAMQQSQIGQQKLEDDAALRQAAAEAGGDPKRLRDVLMSKGQVSAALAIDKDIAVRDKEQRAAEQADIARKAEKAKYWRDQLATVGPNNYGQFIQAARADKMRFAEDAPEQFDPAWQKLHMMDSAKFLEQANRKLHIANEGGMGGVGRDPVTGQIVHPGEPLTPTPSQDAKAPQKRERIVGGSLIQEEYQPDGTWKEIGRGPRWKEDGPTTGAGRSYIPAEHVDLHGDAYLATLPPGVRSSVKAVAEGRAPLSSLSIRGGEREAMIQRASQYDPTFDASIAPARAATRKDFTSGVAARNVTAINTAIGHIGTLDELGDALKNRDPQLVNRVVNTISSQLGRPEVNNFDIARGAVGDELMRVFRQVGASKEESDSWKAKFDSANSPEKLKGAVKTAAELLQSRIEALDDQWKRGMGTDKGYPDLLSPKSQGVMAKVSKGSAPAPQYPTATAPNGRKVIFKDGKWQNAP
jgi:hypothetical protein